MSEKEDPLFEQAVRYLEKEEKAPSRVSNKFLAACIRKLHQSNCETAEKAKANDRRILRLEILLGLNGGGLIFFILKHFSVF